MTDTDEAAGAVDRAERLALMNAGIEAMIPIAHQMGVRIVELDRGRVVGRVEPEGNTNHIGTIYAGVLFTVAEILGGAIVLSTFDPARFYPTVREVKIRFRRPARTAVHATAVLAEDVIEAVASTAEAQGKADFALTAELTDADGVVVATTEGSYQLRAHGT